MDRFLYQIDKKELDKNIELNLFFVDKDKKTQLKTINVPYQIYIEKSKFEDLKIDSKSITITRQNIKDINEQEVLLIQINNKEIYEYIISQARDMKINTYEQDLPAEHTYLIDKEIRLIDSKREFLNLKYISIDIETIGEKNNQEIILISTQNPHTQQVNRVYLDKSKLKKEKAKEALNTRYKNFELIAFDNEKKMLEQFKKDLIEFEPQLIIGWNVIEFDFKVIKERFNSNNIEFKFSKFEGDTKLRIFNDFFKRSSMSCPGVLVFDVIQILKMNYIDFDDFKLDTVAKSVLKDEKIELENGEDADTGIEEKISAITYMFENNPSKLIEYNFKDSYLTSAIFEELKLMELMCKRSILTGTPLSKVKSPIATLDIMYLKKLHKKGLVAPSNFNFSDQNSIEGAFVLNPKKGFYENIFVLDFKSLYPSIIMTFNIDPFTFSKNGTIKAPNNARFTREPGILPKLILKLYKERDKAKLENDKIKSYALKINMNSFYGAMASPKSRFHNHDLGEAITGFARHIIQKAIKYIEEKGHKVIYSDTDSVFVKSEIKFKNLEAKKKWGKELEIEINKFFQNWVSKEFEVKNYLNIEFEKLYSKFFIASKKRYVGFDEFSKKIGYTGMEAIRGDWTELAKDFQKELVKRMFAGEEKEKIRKFILMYVEKLKNKEFDDLLIYKKRITKPLNQYTKTTPPHVKAARELDNFGGKVVKYVMTKNGPKHIRLIDESLQYDYEHYIQKQLKGVSDDLLESFGIDFDEVIFSKKQTALDKFF